jgi:hypothetical protein
MDARFPPSQLLIALLTPAALLKLGLSPRD